MHMEALNSLHSAGWFVLACRGGTNIALELARMGKPLLVVEADPEHFEELQVQLREESDQALTVYCELLGAEDGEISWHRYNDSRQNGTTGLKALQAHFPNLRLLSHESRNLRRLDSVLGDWEKSIHSAADSLLEGLGALVVFGIEALPVLQGGDSWLERFSKLLVPPPLLEANGDLEAWPDLLRRHYIKPSSDNQQDALVLLEQDRERLLEERLQQAINRINTLEAEHDALKTERDGLVTKQQELTTQRDTLSKERDALKTGGTCLRNPFDIAKGTPRYSEADWRDLT